MTTLTRAEIKRACNILRRDDGVGPGSYVEQLSWLLFLRTFELVEQELKDLTEADGRKYKDIVEDEYKWSSWAKKDWKDKDKLIHFVNKELFPYLRGLRGTPQKEKISSIFTEIDGNRIRSPHTLLDVVDILNEVRMSDFQDTHLLSRVYEEILQDMGTEGGWGGEFYTPRPVIKMMVKMSNPKISERIFDPFVGSGGFLVEAFQHILEKNPSYDINEWEMLQKKTFFGQEKKPLPYLVGTMNLVLHGILTPNLIRTNTLKEDVFNVSSEHKYDLIITNPPFGGKEDKIVQESYPYPVTQTAALSLQYVMRHLKNGGRAAIILPESDVVFSSGKYTQIRKELFENYNVHSIISLPKGIFKQVGADVKTYILFFDKNGKTNKIWYYNLKGNFTKTNKVEDMHLQPILDSHKARVVGDDSFIMTIDDLKKKDFNFKSESYDSKSREINLDDTLASISNSLGKLNLKFDVVKKALLEKNGYTSEKKYNMRDLIIRSKETIKLEDKTTYKRVTIRVNGKGISVRDNQIGNKIGTKNQFIIEVGQFLISKIDARNGAFGIVPEDCDGAIITGNFWAYDINEDLIMPNFFKHLLRSEIFQEFFEKSSQGLTNRRYLQEALFLDQEISIPNIKHQKEIVSILDEIESLKGGAKDIVQNAEELNELVVNKIMD